MFERLKKMALFHDLPDHVLEDIAQFTEERLFHEGEIVIQEHADGFKQDLLLLESGSVTVGTKYSPLEHVQDQMLYSLNEQLYGEIAWVLSSRRTACVISTSHSVFLLVQGEALYRYLYQHPKVGLVIMERIAIILARRIAYLDEQIRDQALSYDQGLL